MNFKEEQSTSVEHSSHSSEQTSHGSSLEICPSEYTTEGEATLNRRFSEDGSLAYQTSSVEVNEETFQSFRNSHESYAPWNSSSSSISMTDESSSGSPAIVQASPKRVRFSLNENQVAIVSSVDESKKLVLQELSLGPLLNNSRLVQSECEDFFLTPRLSGMLFISLEKFSEEKEYYYSSFKELISSFFVEEAHDIWLLFLRKLTGYDEKFTQRIFSECNKDPLIALLYLALPVVVQNDLHRVFTLESCSQSEGQIVRLHKLLNILQLHLYIYDSPVMKRKALEALAFNNFENALSILIDSLYERFRVSGNYTKGCFTLSVFLVLTLWSKKVCKVAKMVFGDTPYICFREAINKMKTAEWEQYCSDINDGLTSDDSTVSKQEELLEKACDSAKRNAIVFSAVLGE